MGKSTVAAMFRRLGVPVYDADAAVRALQGPGGAALGRIEAAFPGVTGVAGLDRAKLGAAVFGAPEKLRVLEGILYPLIAETQARFRRRWRHKRLVVLDVPLLFEKGGWRTVDMTVVASAPARVQRGRVLARPGMTRDKFAGILAQQMGDAEKRARADLVVETGRGRLLTWRTVRALVRELG